MDHAAVLALCDTTPQGFDLAAGNHNLAITLEHCPSTIDQEEEPEKGGDPYSESPEGFPTDTPTPSPPPPVTDIISNEATTDNFLTMSSEVGTARGELNTQGSGPSGASKEDFPLASKGSQITPSPLKPP